MDYKINQLQKVFGNVTIFNKSKPFEILFPINPFFYFYNPLIISKLAQK